MLFGGAQPIVRPLNPFAASINTSKSTHNAPVQKNTRLILDKGSAENANVLETNAKKIIEYKNDFDGSSDEDDVIIAQHAMVNNSFTIR
jgi:hypothetical protein